VNALPGNSFVEISHSIIRPQQLLDIVASHEAGAVLLFLGTVRELTHGRRTLALDYDAYPEMALPLLRSLVAQALEQWTLSRVAVVHRLGHLELGETSVAVAVSAPHRGEAFQAGQFLIDELKRRIPIWKKENWDDGSTAWVHPDLNAEAPPPPAGSATPRKE
jgi:molybdopterin synthase catalytic subunit